LQVEKPIEPARDTQLCGQVIVMPWVIEGPDGEPMLLGHIVVRQEC
jgi:hypothetical protein